MAYGARLESVLGASPRGFESPILRHRTPGPLQVPGFSLCLRVIFVVLQGKVPLVGEGRCSNESHAFPLVMKLWGKIGELSTKLVRQSAESFLLWAPLVFRAPSGPAAREIATREPAARSGRSRSPPVPSGPSGTLHTGGALSLMCGSVRRLEARPGPAIARVHRKSLA